MIKQTTIVYLALFFSVGLASAAQPAASATQPDYSTGKKRAIEIMLGGGTEIASEKAEDTTYAQTKNLGVDLNIEDIVAALDPATQWGKVFLTLALQNPLSPADQSKLVERRQAMIRMLVENPEFKQKVELLLAQVKGHEGVVNELFSEGFKEKTYPELAEDPNKVPSTWESWTTYNPWWEGLRFLGQVSAVTTTVAGAIILDGPLLINLTNGTLPDKNVSVNAGLTTGLAILLSCWGYKDYKDKSDERVKIHSLNQVVNAAEQLNMVTQQAQLDNQFKMSDIQDEKKKQFIKAIKASRYRDQKNYIFMLPLVHIFLHDIYQKESYLAQIFASIGEIDACNALATKIVAQQDADNKFCFAEFSDSAAPLINAQGSWNMLIDKPVLHSINESKNIILTGPNAGGKSTTNGEILGNIILAQTFGIAAAQSFELTKFDYISSYFNVQDDIKQGDSLFVSEVKKAKEILNTANALKGTQKLFGVFDELFTGTSAEEGEECAYRFAQNIGENPRIMLIYATHFNKLTQLEKEIGSRWANYKVDALENADGSIKYLYTLSKGKSTIRFGMKIAEKFEIFGNKQKRMDAVVTTDKPATKQQAGRNPFKKSAA